VFGDAREHLRADLISIVESKDDVGPTEASESLMRTGLAFDRPADPKQGS